ncbi:MAG: DUF4854 domain-containing protein [Mogibacterium sp.]|nr:DUF4854 domain-containing protein [Mogibacterium sp.]
MKRRSIIAVLISLTLVMAMALSACGSKEPDTLEKYIQNDEKASAEIQQTADTNGLEVSIKGNDVVYTYDLKNFEGVTEELAKSDTMKESLASALTSAGTTFSDLCKQLEEGSKIEGIQIIVNYTYDGETLVTKTFNKDGAVD